MIHEETAKTIATALGESDLWKVKSCLTFGNRRRGDSWDLSFNVVKYITLTRGRGVVISSGS